MIVNAGRSTSNLLSEQGMLEAMDDAPWTAAVAENGPGIRLADLSRIAPLALTQLASGGTAQAYVMEDESTDSLELLRRNLAANERADSDFIIANFDQGVFTADESVGHFSPIGAYDAATHRVLILDVDRQYVDPYWVPDTLLLHAMAKIDAHNPYHRGFLYLTKVRP
jgi:hypothetical protein